MLCVSDICSLKINKVLENSSRSRSMSKVGWFQNPATLVHILHDYRILKDLTRLERFQNHNSNKTLAHNLHDTKTEKCPYTNFIIPESRNANLQLAWFQNSEMPVHILQDSRTRKCPYTICMIPELTNPSNILYDSRTHKCTCTICMMETAMTA